jgi:hypothetical protein
MTIDQPVVIAIAVTALILVAVSVGVMLSGYGNCC